MKIVIAPQSFKGSLSAQEVAHAIVTGVKRVLADTAERALRLILIKLEEWQSIRCH